MDTHEVAEVLWAYLCSVGYAGANINIWHYHHVHFQWTHMRFLKSCGRICLVLDMVVLRPIYVSLAPRTFPVDSHEVFEVLWAYLCTIVYTGANTNIWH